MDSRELQAILKARVACYGEDGGTSQGLGSFTLADRVTAQRWVRGEATPVGENLIRVWFLLRQYGYEAPEMDQIDPLFLYLGELLAYRVITMSEVKEYLELKSDSGVFEAIRGEHRPYNRAGLTVEELQETYDDALAEKKAEALVLSPAPPRSPLVVGASDHSEGSGASDESDAEEGSVNEAPIGVVSGEAETRARRVRVFPRQAPAPVFEPGPTALRKAAEAAAAAEAAQAPDPAVEAGPESTDYGLLTEAKEPEATSVAEGPPAKVDAEQPTPEPPAETEPAPPPPEPATPPVPTAPAIPLVQPPSVSRELTIMHAAGQVLNVMQWVTWLNSDECSDADRARFRELLGQQNLQDIATALNSLKSNKARQQYLGGRSSTL